WSSSQDDEAGDMAASAPELSAEQQRANQIEYWLDKGQLAYETDRLVLPPNDSAVYYYRQVLAVESGNAQARAG
ncbi:MAG: hypothetical protein IT470_01345, partial [Pseudomonadales bacterium]|nr:hypothetical protein [Pseudomonadales bacterium]